MCFLGVAAAALTVAATAAAAFTSDVESMDHKWELSKGEFIYLLKKGGGDRSMKTLKKEQRLWSDGVTRYFSPEKLYEANFTHKQ